MEDLKTALEPETSSDNRRDRLCVIVQAGDSNKYLGKEYTIKGIEGLTNKELEKLYPRYEAKFGKEAVTMFGNYIFGAYSKIVGLATPIEFYGYDINLDSEEDLTNDLENDPFISKSMASKLGEFYYNYGTYISPFAVTLITAKHLNFNKTIKNPNIINGTTTSSGGTAAGASAAAPAGAGAEAAAPEDAPPCSWATVSFFAAPPERRFIHSCRSVGCGIGFARFMAETTSSTDA